MTASPGTTSRDDSHLSKDQTKQEQISCKYKDIKVVDSKGNALEIHKSEDITSILGEKCSFLLVWFEIDFFGHKLKQG